MNAEDRLANFVAMALDDGLSEAQLEAAKEQIAQGSRISFQWRLGVDDDLTVLLDGEPVASRRGDHDGLSGVTDRPLAERAHSTGRSDRGSSTTTAVSDGRNAA
jgi:hypothetical protein